MLVVPKQDIKAAISSESPYLEVESVNLPTPRMCTVLIAYQPQTEWSVIIGANRDEKLDRQWEPPRRHWLDSPQIVGGLDIQSRGTWLAVNDSGLVATLLNRQGTLGGIPGKKSRGQLVLDALKSDRAVDAAAVILNIDATQFSGFQFLVADASGAYWLTSDGLSVSLQPVPQGVNLITSLGMNNLECSRTKRHLQACRQAPLPNPELPHTWNSWIEILSRRAESEQRDGMTIVTDHNYGTVSSTLIGLHKSQVEKNVFLFCPGRPQESKYKLILPENRGQIPTERCS